MWIVVFYMVSISTMSLTPSGDANFFHQSRTGREPPSYLHRRTPGLVTEERGCISTCHRGAMTSPGGRQMFSDTVMAEGSKTDHLYRFHTIPKWELPFVEGTSFQEQTCSIISYSFIFFFYRPFYAGTYRTFYNAAFDLPSIFFLFLQHVFIRNISNFFRCHRP